MKVLPRAELKRTMFQTPLTQFVFYCRTCRLCHNHFLVEACNAGCCLVNHLSCANYRPEHVQREVSV